MMKKFLKLLGGIVLLLIFAGWVRPLWSAPERLDKDQLRRIVGGDCFKIGERACGGEFAGCNTILCVVHESPDPSEAGYHCDSPDGGIVQQGDVSTTVDAGFGEKGIDSRIPKPDPDDANAQLQEICKKTQSCIGGKACKTSAVTFTYCYPTWEGIQCQEFTWRWRTCQNGSASVVEFVPIYELDPDGEICPKTP